MQSKGSGAEKAGVFLRVLSPDCADYVPTLDNDLRTIVHFMMSTSVIIEEVAIDISADTTIGVNW